MSRWISLRSPAQGYPDQGLQLGDYQALGLQLPGTKTKGTQAGGTHAWGTQAGVIQTRGTQWGIATSLGLPRPGVPSPGVPRLGYQGREYPGRGYLLNITLPTGWAAFWDKSLPFALFLTVFLIPLKVALVLTRRGERI